MSTAALNPPPLLFGQQSPSPPPVTSPPFSPSHNHTSSPPNIQTMSQTAEDINMSTSTTLPPQGQNHDRQDADMDGVESGDSTPEHTGNANTTGEQAGVVASAEDAMDTAPDSDRPGQPADGSNNNPVPPPPLDGWATPPPPAVVTIVRGDANDEATEDGGEHPIPPPPPIDRDNDATPPPSPPANPPPPDIRNESDTSSDSDDDEPRRRWHEIREDTSAPDEQELKEIEARGEHSALDHGYFEGLAYTPFKDPEYKPGVFGRIDWTIEHYNGTKERPNRDIVMRSGTAKIGDHEWRIKFYPRGNDTEFLSIYIENITLPPPDPDAPTADDPDLPAPARHAPLPLLPGVEAPVARPSVLAQISVVLYNPAEPRVNYHHTAMHRFSPGSPDWGWTRFHGPYYEIQSRHHGQRAALLRNDQLAMTAYIRLVDDATEVLGEHDDIGKQKWDSFVMTGLQGLAASPISSSAIPGGNLISAVASWMLLKPFRQFLYDVRVPDPDNEPRIRPKPMLKAFQTVLYSMRSQVYPKAGPVELEQITDALDWYGIDEDIAKLDVVQVWEILRGRIEMEVAGTPWEGRIATLFGNRRDRTQNRPTYKIPVKGVETVQEAVESSENFLHPEQPLPQVLQVELDRQEFDKTTRTWKRLVNKAKLDEHITVSGTNYTLYGFIAHKETLQSGLYYPILRPEGPNGKWYQYFDARDSNKVTCLTKREALDNHEGYPQFKCKGNESSCVAYIVLYVRDDIATNAFKNDEPVWDVPKWLVAEVERFRARQALASARDIFAFEPPPPPMGMDSLGESNPPPPPPPPPPQEDGTDPARDITFQVFDSRVYSEHEGPGIIDMFTNKWQSGATPYVFDVTANSKDSLKELRNKIAANVEGVEDERQCKFWLIDSLVGAVDKPLLMGVGNSDMSCGREYITDKLEAILGQGPTEMRLWMHVMDKADLPPKPKEEEKTEEQATAGASPDLPTAETSGPSGGNADLAEETENTHEDTIMSDADEQENDAPAPIDPIVEIPGLSIEAEAPGGANSPFPIPPPFNFGADTEMGGTQEPPPPPPPATDAMPPPSGTQTLPPLPPGLIQIISGQGETLALNVDWGGSPPPAPHSPPENSEDLVYFFLKLFDAEKQQLISKGSHVAKNIARLDLTVLKILGLPEDTTLNYFEEEFITTANPLRKRRSFAHEDIQNANIIIVQHPLNDNEQAKLTAEGKCTDPQSYLQQLSNVRNFPEYARGKFTFDYFSAEFYDGEIKNRAPNGQGTKISHDNIQYTGTFLRGRRHGSGTLTYANGDTYSGSFLDGLPHGQGTFTELATGNVYEGGWKAGKKHGEGVTRWKVAQDTERVCRICWEEEADSAFWDCGHVVACVGCARRVDVCPVCRRRVLGTCKLFYVS